MKQLTCILIVMLSSFTLKGQEMEQVNRTITQLFIATDERNWEDVKAIFATNVLLDYSSMNGNPAASLTPTEITTAWKGILPGFEATHHQIGNLITQVSGNKAKVYCYGTATHFLKDVSGNIWTVVGSYNFELKKVKAHWKITAMKFNFKYQDGNTSLPQKAIKRATK